MQVTINAAPLTEAPPELENFSQLVAWIEEKVLTPRGEVLTYLCLNGEEIDEQKEKDYKDLPLLRIQSLELRSSTPSALAIQGLEDCETVMPEIHKTLLHCLELFETGDNQKAFEVFLVVTDGLQWFSTIYNGAVGLHNEEIIKAGLQDCGFINEAKELTRILNEILKAHDQGDQTTFQDLLEYELAPVIDRIVKEVTPFRKSLAGN